MPLTFLEKILMSHQLHSVIDPWRRFTVAGQRYPYFCHRYNATWRNERAVEVPYATAWVQQYRPNQVLELGNVLSHYGVSGHTVLDKYEQADGVINRDIVNYRPKKKYELIISVSTVEHVGWDEPTKSKTKVKRAVSALKKLLKPGGQLIITVPLGYNPHLDGYLQAGTLGFDQIQYLQRVSLFNTWQEVGPEVWNQQPQYGAPFGNANVVAFCLFQQPTSS